MTWQTSYYHYDGLGSTLCLTDENGDVTDNYAYMAFGEEVDTGAANPTRNPFRYIGREGYYRDADTGDYYIRARTYSPALARWLSEDPIGYKGGMNVYAYVAGNHTSNLDPEGLAAVPGGERANYSCGIPGLAAWGWCTCWPNQPIDDIQRILFGTDVKFSARLCCPSSLVCGLFWREPAQQEAITICTEKMMRKIWGIQVTCDCR
jgi:RHS repeat-associated protein